MSNTTFYLCLETDAGEYELLSSHDTRNEAFAALQELDTTSVDRSRCSIQSIDTLETQIESMTYAIFDVEDRMERKDRFCDVTRQVRATLRRIRDTLKGDSYVPLTEKYIELSDTLEKGERYVANRRHDLEHYRSCIESWTRNLERLRKAVDSLPIVNRKVIDMMEARSRRMQVGNN